jgi:hypothetical protein
VALVDNLSALKQRLISTIPVGLGVKQYQVINLTRQNGQVISFTARVTEPTPYQLSNFMNLGVTINGDNRWVEGIPLTVADNDVRYGRFVLQNGATGESIGLTTTGTVDKKCLIVLNRVRK